MKINNPLHLGASLYVPSTRDDLQAIAKGEKLQGVRSIIFCLEDSVSASDLPKAMENLRKTLKHVNTSNRMVFIRPRNLTCLAELLRMKGIGNVTGFVIPKATAESMEHYVNLMTWFPRGTFALMPTLETKEVFDRAEMAKLHDVLTQAEVQSMILSLRIGGNDLFNILGLRRSRHRTIYESPLGPVITSLVTQFKPSGFNLSSPVCEHLYDYEVLEREMAQDLEYGLFGKTAIHPDQVPVIEQFYKPGEQDYRMAQAILAPEAPAVFNMYGTMCEVATHRQWATAILERAKVYGVFGKESELLHA